MHKLSNAVIEHLYKAADSSDLMNAGIGAGIGAGGAALFGDRENTVRNLILGALAGGAGGAAYDPALKPLAKTLFKTDSDGGSSVLSSALGGATILPAIGAGKDLLQGRMRVSRFGVGAHGPSGSTFKDLANADDLKSIGGTDPIGAEHAERYVNELNTEQIRRKDDIISGKGGIRSKITSLMAKAGPMKSFAERLALNQALSDMLNEPGVTNKILAGSTAYSPLEIEAAKAQHDAGFDAQATKANRFRANMRGLEADLAGGQKIKKIDPDIVNSIRANLAQGSSLENILRSLSDDPNLPEQYKYVEAPPRVRPDFDPASMPARKSPLINNNLIEKLRGTGAEFAKGWGGRLGLLAMLGAGGGAAASLAENGIRKAVGA